MHEFLGIYLRAPEWIAFTAGVGATGLCSAAAVLGHWPWWTPGLAVALTWLAIAGFLLARYEVEGAIFWLATGGPLTAIVLGYQVVMIRFLDWWTSRHVDAEAS